MEEVQDLGIGCSTLWVYGFSSQGFKSVFFHCVDPTEAGRTTDESKRGTAENEGFGTATTAHGHVDNRFEGGSSGTRPD